MKFLLLTKSWFAFLFFAFVFACNDGGQKPGQKPDSTSRTGIANPTEILQLPCDSALIAFQQLTSYDSNKNIKADIEREITNLDDVNSITQYFYLTASNEWNLDVVPGATDPRLCIGVDFNGNNLLGWMTRMQTAGATRIMIRFGMYTSTFLRTYVGPPTSAEYKNRHKRLTAVLVAYKSTKDIDPGSFVGAYNLGGMQP